LERILEKKKEGLKALVFTFDFPERAGLMLSRERREMLRKKQVDYLVECPFVPEISHMEPGDFVKELLVQRLRVRYLTVGADFRFGYQRRGDYRLLQQMGKVYDFQVEVVEKACYQRREISSTFVREELEKGNLTLVNRLLGYPYSITGKVLHGRKIGRTLGLPTVNLQPEEQKLLPPDGVYATRTLVGEKVLEGITNIGYKPTVGRENQRGVETYLFALDQELYGEEITVSFYGYARPEYKFASLEELKKQIQQDVDWGKAYFAKEQ